MKKENQIVRSLYPQTIELFASKKQTERSKLPKTFNADTSKVDACAKVLKYLEKQRIILQKAAERKHKLQVIRTVFWLSI